MKFDSDDMAYAFYSAYAHGLGFSVRKQFIKRTSTGEVKRRTYTCAKEGKKSKMKKGKQVAYGRPITRIGCLAKMTCKLQNDGLLEVISFEANHNHDLAPTPMKHMLRSNRKISFAQKAIADDAEKAGLPTKSVINLLAVQNGGRENNGFLDKDYYNYIDSQRRARLIKGDGQAIMDCFQKSQSDDPSYFYSVQLDDDDLIMNMFWADSRSILDYKYFGDVVCFDTTYRINKYGRPFAPFVGVNHLKETIIFGAALLYDETITSFKWLFETFLRAMAGTQPKTILTDQSAAMAKAIEEVLTETHHRLCVWHIYQNAAKHLSHAFHASSQFAVDFGSCVYDYEDEDKWYEAWDAMLKRYNLENNEWLHGIFLEREKWAMVYGRHMFTADMMSTQRSESMNNVLKKYLKRKHNMVYFFEHYGRLIEDRRYKELLSEFNMRNTSPTLRADVEVLRQASEIYTPKVFLMFQEEYLKVWDCTIDKTSKTEVQVVYKVRYAGRGTEHQVRFELSSQVVECSCRKFDFVGILCAHALKVLDKKNIKHIPKQYILKRWTKDAKDGQISSSTQAHGESKELIGKRYLNLNYNFREISSLAAENGTMYEHTFGVLSNLLKDLQGMKKCSHGGTSNESLCSKGEQDYPIVAGVKTKATFGQPKGRPKGALERRKNRKSQTKPQVCFFF
ncbi:unnamed protein product [Linum tenue]|uniref:Protein FAR1-RELATED SEQUENCE n=1 Tax=Linum tenue TaxID=586396 RepID=A0AAV0MB38_9ROSI|nr:unnamed protein product [Linum tenue]